MSAGFKRYGVTFGIGKNGTWQSPNQSGDDAVVDIWLTPANFLARSPWERQLPLSYHLASTEDGIVSFSSVHCSITGDMYERPLTVERFTALDSEWVSTFDHLRPPTLVPTESPVQPEAQEEEGNAGYRAVLWLKDFFNSSQSGACAFAGVPEATFYVWQKNPSSSVRSVGARRALKLRASLEVAIARVGLDPIRSRVSAGSPSIEDRLRDSRGADWERAVSEIARFGTYEVSAPLPRISSADEYLQRVREIDDATVDRRSRDGARLMSEGEIREADQKGW